ncbi:uncharacterized protein JKF63_07952 [Porcisia hertigi]|uniref:Leucine-rich repeat protein n=1 Tax=Porcisia hertigi TaxID=2761500 RepID=A0A836HLC7_9TRYP|nr:hypothetical protein JKF63_07952 [Porcisia hertigi]
MLCPVYAPRSAQANADPGEEEVQLALRDGTNTLFFSHHVECTDVPRGIVALRDQLEILHVDNNYRFTSISPRVTALTNLRWLNASYCSLRSVDFSISRLTKLERLTLNNNMLDWLPPEMAQLKSLNELHIGNNKFRVLPGCLLFLPHLRLLEMENNPFCTREAVEGAAAVTFIPPQRIVMCSSCFIHSRYYHVFVTFHRILDHHDVPFVHLVCSEECAKHVRRRLEEYDLAHPSQRSSLDP